RRVDAEQGGLAVGVDAAVLHREQTGDGLEQGRLAAAVGADQADGLAPVGDEGHVPHRVHPAYAGDLLGVLAAQHAVEGGGGGAASGAGSVDPVDDVDAVGDDG